MIRATAGQRGANVIIVTRTMARVSRFGRFFPPAALAPVALASVVANVAIVVTGGAVRLTDSGLGCPTWPRCTDESYHPTPEMGVHGAIEFGNRLLSFVLTLIALAGLLAAIAHRHRSRRLVPLATAVLLGIPAQAVIGGVTVLTDLNPWVVNLHFLASMAVLVAAYAYWTLARAVTSDAPADRDAADGAADQPSPAAWVRPVRALAWLVTAVSAAVLVVGTWVTGSGPHSGDRGAARNGLDPQEISQAHADLVFLLLGLSVGLWLALRAVGASARAVRAAAWLVGWELAQGLVGMVQYFTNLPRVLVGAHMLGSCLVWLATLSALHHARDHEPSRLTMASAKRAAAPAEWRKNSEGSVSSSSTTIGVLSGPGIRSTRA